MQLGCLILTLSWIKFNERSLKSSLAFNTRRNCVHFWQLTQSLRYITCKAIYCANAKSPNLRLSCLTHSHFRLLAIGFFQPRQQPLFTSLWSKIIRSFDMLFGSPKICIIINDVLWVLVLKEGICVIQDVMIMTSGDKAFTYCNNLFTSHVPFYSVVWFFILKYIAVTVRQS